MTEQSGGQADSYQGAAKLRVAGTTIDVEVTLRGCFQPIDGRYHWHGRLAANEQVHTIVRGKKVAAFLETPHGEAHGQVSDPDPWGRYRITGISTPPF